MYVWQKNEGVILDDRNFDRTNTSLHPCLTLSRRMVFVSIFSSEKNELQNRKKIRKFSNFFHRFVCPKKPERKNFHVTFSLKRSPFTLYKTLNPAFDLGDEK